MGRLTSWPPFSVNREKVPKVRPDSGPLCIGSLQVLSWLLVYWRQHLFLY